MGGRAVTLWTQDHRFGSRPAHLCVKVSLGKTLNPMALLGFTGLASGAAINVGVCEWDCDWKALRS